MIVFARSLTAVFTALGIESRDLARVNRATGADLHAVKRWNPPFHRHLCRSVSASSLRRGVHPSLQGLDRASIAPTMPLSPGFISPCLPIKAPSPPTGGMWLHEIKHDGFRVIARKIDERVQLYSRPGND